MTFSFERRVLSWRSSITCIIINIISYILHCQIKEVTGKKRGNGTTTYVEAKDGTIIMEKDKIPDRWSEYIGERYDDDRGEMPVIVAPGFVDRPRWSDCTAGQMDGEAG